MLDSATVEALLAKFIVGILIFVRITGLMASAPFLKSAAIPPQVKIFLSVIIATMITSAFWEEQAPIEFHLWVVTFLVLKEFAVGLIIGFSANAVFWAAKMAGGIIDTEMGYQTAMVFDRSNDSPTLLGEFKETIVLMLFFFINGHHYLFEGIVSSLRAVPIGVFEITTSTLFLLTKMASTIFIVAIKIASPLIVALFLTNLSLALLARVAPQTNIFVLSFQMKVVVGLITLFAFIPLMIMVSKFALGNFEEVLYQFMLSLNPGRV